MQLNRRKDGYPYWEVDLRLPGERAPRWRSTGQSDAAAAERTALVLFGQVRVARDVGAPATKRTFAQAARKLLAKVRDKLLALEAEYGKGSPKLRACTQPMTIIEKRLVPYFGQKSIDGITETHLRGYVATPRGREGRPVARGTILNHNHAFRMVLKAVVAEGWIKRSNIPKLPTEGHENGVSRVAFRPQELRRVVEGMTDRWIETGFTSKDDAESASAGGGGRKPTNQKRVSRENRIITRAAVVILAASGLRPGTETFGLRACDIDEHDREDAYSPSRVLIRVGHGKGKRQAARDVYIQGDDAETVRAALADLRRLNPNRRDTDRLFSRPSDGRVVSPLRTFQAYLASAGLLLDPTEGKARCIYSVRHYVATRLIARGFSTAEVAIQLGTGVQMIDNFYLKRAQAYLTDDSNQLVPPRKRPLVPNPYVRPRTLSVDGEKIVLAPLPSMISPQRDSASGDAALTTSQLAARS